MSNPNKTVLIFDSGVGGLSVFQEIKAQLPQLNYLYVFDNQAYPYGELEPETLVKRVDQIVADFTQSHQIDAMVVACNTASTIVLPTLRARYELPIVGVVPAIKPASLLSSKAVGLIATPATIHRQYTLNLIKDFSSDKPVELLGSTALVDIAESKLRGQAVDLDDVARVLMPIKGKIDVAVLGCTHFPLLREEIQQVLGKHVLLVDSGRAIANRVKALLNLSGGKREGQYDVFCSAPTWQEGALNAQLKVLGFSAIQHYELHFQGALDH